MADNDRHTPRFYIVKDEIGKVSPLGKVIELRYWDPGCASWPTGDRFILRKIPADIALLTLALLGIIKAIEFVVEHL